MPTMVSYFTPLGALAVLGLALALTPSPAPLTLDEVAEVAIGEMRLGLDDERVGQRFHQVLSQDPDHLRANFGIGMAAYSAKQYKASSEHLQRALAKAPENHEIKLALATAFQKQLRVDEAMALYEELRKADPRDSRVINNLAEIEISRGNYAAARAHLASYLAMLPARATAARSKVELRIARLDAMLNRDKPSAPRPDTSPVPRKTP